METPQLILASASPRRRELLARAGYTFRVHVADVEESMPPAADPATVAMDNAQAKARAAAASLADRDAVVVGADTVVALDGRIWGKPEDEAAAVQILRTLSGRTHEVVTGVYLVRTGTATSASDGDAGATADGESFAERTRVSFRQLSDTEIADYVAGGEPLDKAGAYGIQGEGARLVAAVEGDLDNVVGLPVAVLATRLAAYGIQPMPRKANMPHETDGIF